MGICTHKGNFCISLSFRFYVKPVLENVEFLKNAIFTTLGALNFVNSVNFSVQWAQKVINIIIQSLQFFKMADFALLESPKLISRKSLVIGKLPNIHIVQRDLHFEAVWIPLLCQMMIFNKFFSSSCSWDWKMQHIGSFRLS